MSNVSAVSVAAESLVRGKLLSKGNRQGIRVYRAVVKNEVGFDLVIIWPPRHAIFVQVKGRDIACQAARFQNLDREFDIFVAVIFDGDHERYFVLTKEEVNEERKRDYYETDSISLSIQEHSKFVVRSDLGDYEDAWWKCLPTEEFLGKA